MLGLTDLSKLNRVLVVFAATLVRSTRTGSAGDLESTDTADQLRFAPASKTWLVSIVINDANQTLRSKWLPRTVSLTSENFHTDQSKSKR